MKYWGRRTRNGRLTRGAQISEMAVGMFVLLIFFFFPLVDMLSIAVSYGLCMVLNTNQVREASLLPRNQATAANGLIRRQLPDQWRAGMGTFVKMVGRPRTDVTYRTGHNDDMIVRVDTTITCSPFLHIPIPAANVPGLNGPMTFTITAEKPMENPDHAL